MHTGKNTVVLVVISFLLVILIYSSNFKLDAFAKKTYSQVTCTYTTKNQDSQTCCYTEHDTVTGVNHDFCKLCVKNPQTANWDCSDWAQTFRTSGNTPLPPAGPAQPTSTPPPPSNETYVNNLPGNIGTVQSPSTPPPPSLNAIPPPSALPSPTKQQTLTTTCPNGLPPDANGNCPSTPTTTTNQQGGLTSNNNNPTSEHHKGSNQPTQTGGGGQELTATKKTQRIKNRSRNNTIFIVRE
jgi:hypothetical protein